MVPSSTQCMPLLSSDRHLFIGNHSYGCWSCRSWSWWRLAVRTLSGCKCIMVVSSFVAHILTHTYTGTRRTRKTGKGAGSVDRVVRERFSRALGYGGEGRRLALVGRMLLIVDTGTHRRTSTGSRLIEVKNSCHKNDAFFPPQSPPPSLAASAALANDDSPGRWGAC